MTIQLRDAEEIQRAHDIFVSQITGDTPAVHDDMMPLIIACDVLCWVLKHQHNDTFAKNLEEIERELQSLGFDLQRSPLPFSRQSICN